MIRTLLTTALSAGLLALPALAEQHMQSDAESGSSESEGFTTAARAAVTDRDGNEIGTVTVNETESGMPMLIVALSGLPDGAHGIHIHETGDCSADDFTSAGGHVAGEAKHGVFASGGPHPGDLPNAIVGSDGDLNIEVFDPLLRIDEMIMDDDGAAFIVHSGADDYMSQPSGDAGDRIACGAFEKG